MNVLEPIDEMLSGNSMLFRPVQSSNADSSIEMPSGSSMELSDEQPANACLDIFFSPLGRLTVSSDVQPLNISAGIVNVPLSNVTLFRLVQSAKMP